MAKGFLCYPRATRRCYRLEFRLQAYGWTTAFDRLKAELRTKLHVCLGQCHDAPATYVIPVLEIALEQGIGNKRVKMKVPTRVEIMNHVRTD
jgi:hypothetical protein